MKHKIALLLLTIIPFSVGQEVFSVRAVSSIENGWEEPSIMNEYSYNSYLDITDCSYFKNGAAYHSDHILTFPDGTVTGNDRVLLNIPGKYNITYTANVNNSIYSKDYYFNVPFSIVSYNNPNKTSYKYGLLSELNAGDSTIRSESAQGLYVRLAANDTLTFNQWIDLKDISSTDTLIKVFAMPDTWHEEEMNAIQFKLIDSSDPTNYMTILSTRYSDYGYTYTMAAGSGQVLTGWERTGSKNIKHINDGWGTPCSHSFGGTAITNFTAKDYYKINVNERCLTFSYDKFENRLYSFGKTSDKVKGAISTGDLSSATNVCDFDNPEDFTSLWKGFKSNKVKLEVTCVGTSKETASLCFVDVFGIDLTSSYITKTAGPEITIEQFDTVPYGEVNKAYKIPEATAFDEYFGKCNVTKTVYYRYDSDEFRRHVSINNNSFTPTKPGLYAIVYRANDFLGNVSEEVLQVIVNHELDPISFDIPKISDGYVGQKIKIPSIDLIKGGSGLYDVDIQAKLDSEIIKVIDNNFVPNKAGTWTINYIVTDYIGNSLSKSININVTAKDGYFAENTPNMYPGFILNNTYQIPVLTLCKFDSQGNKTTINSKVKIDGQIYNSGDSFIPKSSENEGFMTIEYFEGNETFIKYNVPFLNNVSKSIDEEGLTKNEFAADRYFITNGTRTWLETGVQIVSKQELTETSFANFVSAYDFSLEIGNFSYFNNNNEIEISLTDYSDSSSVASLMIIKKNYGYDIKGFDDNILQIADTDNFLIKFNGKHFIINNSYEVSANINSQPDGVMLTIKSDKGTGYVIKSILGSQVTNSLRNLQDKQGPNITFTDNYGGTKEINEIYKICKANIFDLFSPNVNKSLTVKDPDGNVVVTIDGEILQDVDPSKDRYIKLDKFGAYKFEYKASETSEYKTKFNSYNKTYMVEVIDSVAPTISFTSHFVSQAKVGDLVVLPNYVVKDNYSSSENIKVRISVINPDGLTSYLRGNSFYVNNEGTYKICYFVFDDAGNSTIVNKFVEVSK